MKLLLSLLIASFVVAQSPAQFDGDLHQGDITIYVFQQPPALLPPVPGGTIPQYKPVLIGGVRTRDPRTTQFILTITADSNGTPYTFSIAVLRDSDPDAWSVFTLAMEKSELRSILVDERKPPVIFPAREGG